MILIKYYSLSSLGTFKNEIIEELKKSKRNDLEDRVYRYQLTNDELTNIIDLKDIPPTTIGYTLPPGMYEITDTNLMSNSLLPKEVKVKISVEDVRIKSNLTTNKTIRFTKKSFFYVISGFTQSHLGELGDTPSFIQLIPGSFKSDIPMNITGIDKVHLKADCLQGSIVGGVRESI